MSPAASTSPTSPTPRAIGGPELIPWDVQYALGTQHAVGRIPLSGQALGNYIDALLSGWQSATTALDRALGWTVVHNPPDITTLMNTAIAKPLAEKLNPPPLTEFRQLNGDRATAAALLQALEETSPCLVVTSSHGRTGPLSDKLAVQPAPAGKVCTPDCCRLAVPRWER